MFWNIRNSPESMPVRWSLSSTNHQLVGRDSKAFSPLRIDKDRTQKLSGKKKKVSPTACITNCWKTQMEGMTGKAITSPGLPFCLDSKETNTKFHHRLKCYLNILENVALLSEIRPALLQQPINKWRWRGPTLLQATYLRVCSPRPPICHHRLEQK